MAMQRREFIKLVGGVAASWPLAALAQQKAMPVIGYAAGSVKLSHRFFEGVRSGLAQVGYIEDRNFRFDLRDANFQNDLIPAMFREMVKGKVSLIITATTLQLQSAKAATQSVPIVFSVGTDPVENRFVASLTNPGGNITGVFTLNVNLTGKRFEVLRELVPSVTKFAFLMDPGNQNLSALQTKHSQAAASSLGLTLIYVYAHSPDEFEAAFKTAVREGAGGIVVGTDGLFGGASRELAAVAASYGLPAIYHDDLAMTTGGLVCYTTDQDEPNRLVGTYAGRILKGENPADMPVHQATKTKLVINLKTAKAMGITVPISLLGRADEVIE
jgi:putative tryptophan/tyrosine transport system substrate-binding protein